eukprot:gene18548-biopygen20456
MRLGFGRWGLSVKDKHLLMCGRMPKRAACRMRWRGKFRTLETVQQGHERLQACMVRFGIVMTELRKAVGKMGLFPGTGSACERCGVAEGGLSDVGAAARGAGGGRGVSAGGGRRGRRHDAAGGGLAVRSPRRPRAARRAVAACARSTDCAAAPFAAARCS